MKYESTSFSETKISHSYEDESNINIIRKRLTISSVTIN